jgi:hypothetical protein
VLYEDRSHRHPIQDISTKTKMKKTKGGEKDKGWWYRRRGRISSTTTWPHRLDRMCNSSRCCSAPRALNSEVGTWSEEMVNLRSDNDTDDENANDEKYGDPLPSPVSKYQEWNRLWLFLFKKEPPPRQTLVLPMVVRLTTMTIGWPNSEDSKMWSDISYPTRKRKRKMVLSLLVQSSFQSTDRPRTTDTGTGTFRGGGFRRR